MPGGQPHPGPRRPEDPCPPESYAVLLGRHCAFRSYVADPLRFVNFYPGLGPISPESPCNARKRVGICMHRCQIHPVMLHARYAPQSTPRGPSALRPGPSPGILHHLMLRGIERRAIFRAETVAEAFLARYLLPAGDKEVSLYLHKFKQLEAERCPVPFFS